ncbi:MAG: hypothetical protein EXR72_23485 [Myxococcales bacterium]|nr:hypothetical protein [Myxococcales bacterium]
METKKDILLALLRTSSAFLQLDARAEGVMLPDFLMGERGVVLQLAYDFAIPIPDLAIDDEGVTATLSFRRVPFCCRVPWRAVYAITDGAERRAVFPEDMPGDLSVPPTEMEPEPPPPPPRPARPSHLKLVK